MATRRRNNALVDASKKVVVAEVLGKRPGEDGDLGDDRLSKRPRPDEHNVDKGDEKIQAVLIPSGQTLNPVRGEAVLACDQCDYTTTKAGTLKTHKWAKHTEPKHKCPECDYTSHSPSVLKVHMRIHTGEKPFKCDQCDYSARRAANLRNHKIKHSGEKPFQCPECKKTFAKKWNCDSHIKGHDKHKSFICDKEECTYKGGRASQLVVHIVNKHKEKLEDAEKHVLSLYPDTKKKAFRVITCAKCDYVCATKGSLAIHMRTHTGEKPFKCDLCDYSARAKNLLTMHRRSNHSNDKQFKCKECKFQTAFKHVLKDHVLRRHTVDKPFKCTKCNYSSSNKYSLRMHDMVHTGERPYPCKECSDAFKTASHLKRHMMQHTGEKPFRCHICQHACTQKGNLMAHMKAMHPPKLQKFPASSCNGSVTELRTDYGLKLNDLCPVCRVKVAFHPRGPKDKDGEQEADEDMQGRASSRVPVAQASLTANSGPLLPGPSLAPTPVAAPTTGVAPNPAPAHVVKTTRTSQK